MIKIAISMLLFFNIDAYEVPKVKINTDKRPEIVLFKAESVSVDKKLSYDLQWDTKYATNVMLTYFGKVDKSGTVTITEDEYKRGAITLTVSSDKSSFSDSQTINKNLKADAEAPILYIKEQEEAKVQYYNSMPSNRLAPRRYRRLRQ
ncbi:MAG: hypothetical protein ACI9TV_002342 [Sulfurimonas sp.]|jgi:hypothetical protein|uniref:hypothetical protein n=1 Tax=Sulfurimonas sp. TaxID=2022749 RepID=UPI0039E296F9